MKEQRLMYAAGVYAVAISLLGLAASAQTDKPKPTNPATGTTEPATRPQSEMKEIPFCHKASEAIGADVKNAQGSEIGEVKELVVSPVGDIRNAVISIDGKLYALPFNLLNAPEVPEGNRLAYFTLTVDKTKLEHAPSFSDNTWPDIHSPTWSAEIDKYYGGVRPADGFHLLKCSDLLGMDIENMNKDELGEIKEIVLDSERDRISYFVLSSGGFLGLGDKLFAVPWESLKVTPTEDKDKPKLLLDITKERFEKAPEFKEEEWARMRNSEYLREIYTYYGHSPYWTTSRAVEAGCSRPTDPQKN